MAAEEGAPLVRLEQAASDRSHCRATGEAIPKGAWRVGLEVWVPGRMGVTWTWQTPLPFLQHCRVECAAHSGNLGACKRTGHKFQRGEPRFVCTSGESQKVFLTLAAAGQELAPVLRHVGPRAFRPLQFAGVEALAAPEREAFCQAFGVSKAEAARYNKTHPPPAPPSPDAPAAAPRPAKRPRSVAASGSGGSMAAEEEEDGPEGAAGERMTEYERQRAEQIRRNRERMMALQLPALAQELAAETRPKPRPAAAKQKGISTRKQRLSEVLPRRSSLRVQGKAPDGSQVLSERRGEIIVVSGEHIRYNPALAAKEEAPPGERHLKEDLPFRSTNADAASDAAFVQLLARAAAAAPAQQARGAARGKHPPPAAAQIGALRLAESDVAKCTKAGITHLAFHPTCDTLLLACGDKYGHLGLWHVDYDPAAAPSQQAQQEEGGAAAAEAALALDSSSGGEEEEQWEEDGGVGSAGGRAPRPQQGAASSYDGVLQFKPHLEYISGLRWAGGGTGGGAASKLFTGSYDGALRALDLGAGGVSQLAFGDEESEFSAMDVLADGSTAALGDNQGELHLVDLRAGKRAHPGFAAHNRKINTCHFEPAEEQLLVTSSTDSCIHLWDVRKLGPKAKPLATAQHAQTCQAVYFAPDGSKRIATTSFDDTVRVWDGAAGLKPLMRARHDNQTGRWVFPFRAVWGPAADCLVVGNMKRYVDVLGASGGELQAQLSGESMTAIAARNCCHPSLPALAAATASGRVHVYR